jgi:flagellar motor switch protein FliG
MSKPMPSAYAEKPDKDKSRNDIASIVAALASRQAEGAEKVKALTGPERAAVLMLSLGEQYGGKIWGLLDDDELRQLSIVMSTLGTIDAPQVENLLLEFVGRLSASGALMGNYEATERLLHQFLPPERVGGIMDEIRGPAGRNMWEKLSNVQEEVLANYLKNEYPQTIAVVLSKLRPEHAARVLAILPDELALDVVNRMLRMESVQKEVIDRVEQTLRTEFMSNISQTRRRDAHEVMAEIFNNFDRQTETRFLTALEEENRESAERIKTLMFTFDDLVRLDTGSAQTLMRHIDKDKLAVALKGAAEPVRQFFFSNMSTRAAKMLADDMQAMGPVRLRDVDEAQVLLVNLAKDLAAKGEILIAKQRADEELIY